MFARTPEYEELFARGYPHLRRLISPHPDEADAEANALRVIDSSDSVHYHVDWPREVAHRFVRAMPKVGAFGIGLSRHDIKHKRAALAGLATAGPVDEDEGRALVAALVDPSLDHYEFAIEHALFLLEAMIGSAATADAVLAKLESMKQLDGKFSTTNYIAYDLGFIIRRLPARERGAAEDRVRALVASKPESYTRDFLSYLVGGRAALEASGRKLGLYVVHFAEDPDLIVELAHESCAYFDANHAYQAGDRVLAALATRLAKIAGSRKPWLVDELAQIASKQVDPILAKLGETKKLAPRVAAAMAARGVKAGVRPRAGRPVRAADKAKKPRGKSRAVSRA